MTDDVNYIKRIDGLYVGMIDKDEAEAFANLYRRGLMRRSCDHAGDALGMAKAARSTGAPAGAADDPVEAYSSSDRLADYRAGKGFIKPGPSRAGKPPCGECHLRAGETCDICDAHEPGASHHPILNDE